MSLMVVENLGKSYREYGSDWHRFANWFGANIKPSKENWVVRNISFKIEPGECIGILGKNGAGKSTLLKMITGTLQPTEGKVKINGRVAAILELGMGFNPELTGRQNAYYSLGLMGYTLEQIETVIEEIKNFADIGEAFDHPVRTYSSGMQACVAFSVATAFRPDLLIVDEVLAVGDAEFQQKCYNKIKDYTDQGTSLFLVTHSIGDIIRYCSRALLVGEHRLIADGPSEEIKDIYLRV